MRDTGNMSSGYISIVERLAQILDRVQAIESKHIQNLPATLRDNPNRIIVLDILTSGIWQCSAKYSIKTIYDFIRSGNLWTIKFLHTNAQNDWAMCLGHGWQGQASCPGHSNSGIHVLSPSGMPEFMWTASLKIAFSFV